MSVDAIVNGVLVGGLYALAGLGLSLVSGVLRLVNLAHGATLVAGAYAAYLVLDAVDVDPLVAAPAAMVAVGAIAFLLQRYLLTDLMAAGPQAPMIATFGLALLVEAALQGAFSTDPKSLQAGYATAGFDALGVRVQSVYLVAFSLAFAACVATHLVLTRTRQGAVVRAAAADPGMAAALGHDVRRIYALTFASGAALAALAGVMTGTAQSFGPASGFGLLLVAFAVVALGGMGSALGALAGGVALGVIQAVGVEVAGDEYRDVTVYVTFLVVLTVRPAGLAFRGSE